MKKSHYFLLLFMGIMQILQAQPTPERLPDGSTRTTTETTDAAGTRTKLEEYKDAHGTPTGSKQWVTDLQGNTTYTETTTTPGGRPQRVKEFKVKPNGDTTYRKESNYDKRGNLEEYREREYDQNKILKKVTNWKRGDGTDVNTAPEYDPGPLGSAGSSVYKWEGKFVFSGGYSYLNAGTSGDNISFPLGVHVNAGYNITDALGLMADVSYHTKKDMDYRISRLFLMGGLEYNFPQKEETNITVAPHILAGLVSDRQKYLPGDIDAFKESAFAFGAGFKTSYKLNDRLSVLVNPDYIFTRFNDDTQGNIRITGGIKYLFDF